MVKALLQDQLPPEREDLALLEDAHACLVKQIKNDRAHDRNMARLTKMKVRPQVEFGNASLHLADAALTEADLQAIMQHAAEHAMTLHDTSESIHADFHLVTRLPCSW